MSDTTKERVTRALSVAVLGLWILYGHIALSPYAVDDAFIHFRIAENFFNSGKPYFNLSEPVFTTTAPLWSLLLSLLCVAGKGALPLVVPVLNALLLLSNVIVWTALLQRGIPGGGFKREIAVALIVLATLFDASVALMETPLALLLVGGGFLLLRERPKVGMVLLCLSAFARPECSIFLIGVVVALWMKRKLTLGILVWIIAAAAPFFIAELAYFGSLVPQSFFAKSVVYDISTSDFVHLLMHGIFGGEIASRREEIVIIMLGAFLGLILVIIVTEREPHDYLLVLRSSWAVLVPGICSVLILACYLLKRVHLASWYMPLFELPFLFSLLALSILRRRATLAMLTAVAVSPFLFQLCRNVIATVGPVEYYTDFAAGARVRKYRAIGATLQERHPGLRLMAPEIGALGYAYHGRILDAVGLASPEALQFHPMRVPEERPSGLLGAVPLGYIEKERPELIVSMNVFLTSFLESDLSRAYSIIKEPLFLLEDLDRYSEQELWRATEMVLAIRTDVLVSRARSSNSKGHEAQNRSSSDVFAGVD